MTLAERILELRPHALRDAKIEALAQEVLDLQEDLARLTKARSAAAAGGAPQTAIEAASSLWPVTVGGGFPTVVDAIAAAVLAERASSPSRPYVPTSPALAACHARGCTEAETIAVVADQSRSLRHDFTRYLETDARPFTMTLTSKETANIIAAAEREGCAKIADQAARVLDEAPRRAAETIASAIRARK